MPVPVDTEGLIVASGRRRESTPRLVYVTPAHQCPTGAAMSAARRLELLEFAARANAWVVEDDYDSEYRFRSRPLPALQSLDRADRVIYVGSLSKTLLPCLRVGFMVLPATLVEPFARARTLIDRHAPTIEQTALAEFVEQGLMERHIRRMRALYLERRDVLLQVLLDELSGAVDASETDAGLYVGGWLQSGLDEAAVVSAAAAHGVDVLPLSAFYHRAPRQGLVLGFGAYSPAVIRERVKRLAKAIHASGLL